jgi:hypothetical protein
MSRRKWHARITQLDDYIHPLQHIRHHSLRLGNMARVPLDDRPLERNILRDAQFVEEQALRWRVRAAPDDGHTWQRGSGQKQRTTAGRHTRCDDEVVDFL